MKGYTVMDYFNELNNRIRNLTEQNNRLLYFKELVQNKLDLEKEIKTFDEPKPEYL